LFCIIFAWDWFAAGHDESKIHQRKNLQKGLTLSIL